MAQDLSKVMRAFRKSQQAAKPAVRSLSREDWAEAVDELLSQHGYDGLGVDEADSMWERGLTTEQAFNEASEARDNRAAERDAEDRRQYGPSLFWNGAATDV